ncbi:hypothetical protein Tco_0833644 [Tanacetum coccineum]
MMRVQENQDIFRELGVKNISKSLTSLAVAENTKKRRKKDRDTNDKGVEYNPNDFDESGENYQEVATHVSAPKKEQMKNYKPPENESSPIDPFLAVMNKEYDGHRRLFCLEDENGQHVSESLKRFMNRKLLSYRNNEKRLELMRKEFDNERRQFSLKDTINTAKDPI